MGMFDSDLGTPFSEKFKDGEVFTLQGAKVGPLISTEFGPNRPALLTIDGEVFSIFGTGIVNQIEGMEDGDLPARVMVIRKRTKTPGQSVKLIVPEGHTPGDDDIPF
jgi:hypothetical protein